MVTMWRNHKSELFNDYVFGEKKGRDPCIEYEHITLAIWEMFLEQRRDKTFKILRDANIEVSLQNKYPHSLSRGGYQALERRMIQERFVVLRVAAEAEGHDSSYVSIHQVRINRSEKWKESKKSKGSGKYMTKESRLVGERIDELLRQTSERKFVESGREDILVVSLGKLEHPGRVRGIRGGVGIRDYFGSSSRSRGDIVSRGEMELAIKDAISQTLGIVFMAMQNTGMVQHSVGPGIQDITMHPVFKFFFPTSQETSTPHPKSGKGSCSPEPLGDAFKEGDKCSLSIEDPERHVVAYGVLTKSRILHCIELAYHLVRVRIDVAVLDDALLPCPTEEIFVVSHAKRMFVAWPNNLVDLVTSVASHHSKSKEGSQSQSRCPPQKNPNMKVLKDMIDRIFYSSDVIHSISIPNEVAGRCYKDVLKKPDIEDLLKMNLLDISILQVGIMYMHDLCESLLRNAYGFFPPAFLSIVGTTPNDRVDYIAQQLLEAKKEFLIASIIQAAFGNSWCGPGSNNSSKPKWINCNCRRQPESYEFGYYVLRNMFEIVTEGLTAMDSCPKAIHEHFNNTTAYSQDVLDEIRESLAFYLCSLL